MLATKNDFMEVLIVIVSFLRKWEYPNLFDLLILRKIFQDCFVSLMIADHDNLLIGLSLNDIEGLLNILSTLVFLICEIEEAVELML